MSDTAVEAIEFESPRKNGAALAPKRVQMAAATLHIIELEITINLRSRVRDRRYD